MHRSILLGSVILLAAGPAQAAEPTGDWRVADGFANIRIENCGGALWGVVASEKTPGGRDTENPDPALRGRPMLGVPILIDMKPNGDRWDGQVYNSQNGKTYMANIKLLNPNTLRIEGCVLGGLFCGGEEWTRVSVPPTTQGRAAPKGKATGADSVCSRISDHTRRSH